MDGRTGPVVCHEVRQVALGTLPIATMAARAPGRPVDPIRVLGGEPRRARRRNQGRRGRAKGADVRAGPSGRCGLRKPYPTAPERRRSGPPPRGVERLPAGAPAAAGRAPGVRLPFHARRETSRMSMVGVAQLVRAPGCGPGGRRFKSGRSPSRPRRKGRPGKLCGGVLTPRLRQGRLGSSQRAGARSRPLRFARKASM